MRRGRFAGRQADTDRQTDVTCKLWQWSGDKMQLYSHECTEVPPPPTLLLLLQRRSTLSGKAGLLPGSSSLPLKPNGLYRHCTDGTRLQECAEET